jgi:hypothetical protein
MIQNNMRGANAWIKSPASASGNSNTTPSLQERRSTGTNRLSVSTGEDSKEPRVVGWKGETIEAFRPSSIDVKTEEDALSPLDSTSSFCTGKTFWMKFLEDKDLPSFSPSSESESSASLYQEIKRTGTSVSSLTDYSGFKKTSAPAALTVPLDTPNSLSTCSFDKHPSSAKSSDGRKRPSPVAYPPGKLPMQSPRFGSVPNETSFVSPRATQSEDGSMVITPHPSPPLIDQHLSTSGTMVNGDINGNWDSLRFQKTSPKPVQNETSPKPAQNERFAQAYGVWQRARLMKNGDNNENTGRPKAFGRMSLFPQHAQDEPSRPRADPSQALKELPRNEDMDPYEVWRSVGLKKTETGPSSSSSQRIKRSRPSWVSPSKAQSAQKVEPSKPRNDSTRLRMQLPNEKKNPYQVWQRVGLMKKGAGKTGTPPQTAKPPPKPSPVTASQRESPSEDLAIDDEDVDEFQNILKQWRNKSDDKPSSHFLSPSQKDQDEATKRARSMSLSASVVEKENKKNTHTSSYKSRKSVASLGVQDRGESESTIDFFEQMREKLSPRESRSSDQRAQNSKGFEVSPKTKAEEAGSFKVSMSKFGQTMTSPTEDRSGRQSLSPRDRPASNASSILPNLDHIRKISETFDSSGNKFGPWTSLGGNRAIVLLERDNKYEVLVGQAERSRDQQLILQNVEVVSAEKSMNDGDISVPVNQNCDCAQSIFSGNDDLINFFLPQMGMACTCQRQQWGFAKPDNPTAIENVLRPWQVKFLHRFGILHADQLVKARHRSSGILAKAMRQWRMKEGMLAFRTSSCMMAIDIWAKTCKAYVRSVRKQMRGEGAPLATSLPAAFVPELSNYLNDFPHAQTPRANTNVYGIIAQSQVEV